MSENQKTENQGSALETEIWLPFKEATAEAPCCDATIKRAIKGGKLVGRKVGTGHNSSYEITRTSFDKWLETKVKPQREILEPTAEATTQPTTQPTAKPAETGAKPKLTKNERRKLKAARKKEIPESARRLRRWKNFMRHASQEQALAMIKWLSARLAPKKSLSKMILKEALKQDKTQSSNPA